METPDLSQPVELFRYLRTLVNSAETSRNPFPKFALVEAYWHIGRIIVEIEQQGQQRADYGIHLIETLSQQMTDTFGKGYSLPNMWKFKQFFLAFRILSTSGREFTNLRQYLRVELSWSHYRLLMQLENLQERAFYIQQAADEQWTVRFMQRMIRTRYYYQVGLGEMKLPARINKGSDQPAGGPSPTLLRRGETLPLRTRLATIKKMLLEQYVGYAFVAQRQYISVAGEDHWVELVFFQYILNRFVLVHLGEDDPTNNAQFRQLIDGYTDKQPPAINKLPIGFLVDKSGRVKVITGSGEPVLPADEAITLPQTLV